MTFGLPELKRRARERCQPLTAYLELTYRCSSRCVFCYNPRRHDVEPLAAADWVAVLDDLRELGTLWVTFTGGDPLAHPGFVEVARAARERALAVRVFTNGRLVDDAMADVLAALHPASVELSLHGATPEVHDATTREPGSHAALVAAVGRLRARGVRTLLKSPLTCLDEHQVGTVVTLAERLGVPLRFDWMLTPRDDGDTAPLRYRASAAAVEAVMARLHALGRLPTAHRTRGEPACGLGRLTVAVDPEGNVFPCIQWRSSSLGTVRERPLRELWRDSAVRAAAAEVATEASDGLLDQGGALATYPYCPALALAVTGNPLVPMPEQAAAAEAAARVRSRGVVRLAGVGFEVAAPDQLNAVERATLRRLAGAEPVAGGSERELGGAPWVVRLVPEPPWETAGTPLPGAGAAASVAAAGADVRVGHQRFRALVSPGHRRVTLWRDVDHSGPLEVALRVALACRLPGAGGVPLHAAGVAMAGAGLVFFGPSGAGKSTIAGLAPHPVLSDELVAVAAGPGGFEVSATGFWGTMAGRVAPRGFVPLRALVGLDRGTTLELRRLPAREALLDLARVVLIPDSPALWSAALAVLARLVEQVPVYRMQWSPEHSPWAALEGLVESLPRG